LRTIPQDGVAIRSFYRWKRYRASLSKPTHLVVADAALLAAKSKGLALSLTLSLRLFREKSRFATNFSRCFRPAGEGGKKGYDLLLPHPPRRRGRRSSRGQIQRTCPLAHSVAPTLPRKVTLRYQLFAVYLPCVRSGARYRSWQGINAFLAAFLAQKPQYCHCEPSRRMANPFPNEPPRSPTFIPLSACQTGRGKGILYPWKS